MAQQSVCCVCLLWAVHLSYLFSDRIVWYYGVHLDAYSLSLPFHCYSCDDDIVGFVFGGVSIGCDSHFSCKNNNHINMYSMNSSNINCFKICTRVMLWQCGNVLVRRVSVMDSDLCHHNHEKKRQIVV